MQPITVYGIETRWDRRNNNGRYNCMQPITVYGIETASQAEQGRGRLIACSLLPFTVLKLAVAGALSAVACADCMQPITVYGIETR